jgi:hypothetical protein
VRVLCARVRECVCADGCERRQRDVRRCARVRARRAIAAAALAIRPAVLGEVEGVGWCVTCRDVRRAQYVYELGTHDWQ